LIYLRDQQSTKAYARNLATTKWSSRRGESTCAGSHGGHRRIQTNKTALRDRRCNTSQHRPASRISSHLPLTAAREFGVGRGCQPEGGSRKSPIRVTLT
jgi:hypothetical protein